MAIRSIIDIYRRDDGEDADPRYTCIVPAGISAAQFLLEIVSQLAPLLGLHAESALRLVDLDNRGDTVDDLTPSCFQMGDAARLSAARRIAEAIAPCFRQEKAA